ncbi:MAG: protein-L-isoaspartate(D-aspartate) O-methyltransferase [Planctomycetaceae bacterium]|nr:protein-L-isoaspartate(D-aspartate) O-methyltransferase [Planctomycetaceae bacterium]
MTSHEKAAELRRALERRGIRDERVLDVIERVPRDWFVPENERPLAFVDTALAIECGQTISQPYIVALMTESLELDGTERVLEVGTGSGYQSAILAELCREVVTVERHESLSDAAREIHARLGYCNIEYWVGDGTLGCPDRAPFDGILVTAAAPSIPEPLVEQLRLGGRMIVPVGDEVDQNLLRVARTNGSPTIETLCSCRFVKLIGAAGWPESRSDSGE